MNDDQTKKKIDGIGITGCNRFGGDILTLMYAPICPDFLFLC
jgi:hypothetical protein